MIVIVTIVPLVKKFKEMQRKELRSASAAQPGIAEEFDVRKAVLYSEIMAPKFKEE